MESLQRTQSRESEHHNVLSPALSLSSASSSGQSRKGRSADLETINGNVERSSVSMPPPASAAAIARQLPLRRLSKASEGQLLAAGILPASLHEDGDPSAGIPGAGGFDGSLSSVNRRRTSIAVPSHVPEAALKAHSSMPEGSDVDANRLSMASMYSLSSGMQHPARGPIAPSNASSVAGSEPGEQFSHHGATTAASNISVTTGSKDGSLGLTPRGDVFTREPPMVDAGGLVTTGVDSNSHSSATGPASQRAPAGPTRPPGPPSVGRARSRTRTQASRRISGSTATMTGSPGSERSNIRDESQRAEKKKSQYGTIGVCALDTKARSKPSRNILNRLIQNNEFEVHIFGDKIILDEDVENWPICDYLISFFSDGFPLEKAVAYARLRKPFCVNDLPMQTVLWDRRLCLMILDKIKVPTPERIEVNRDGGPVLESSDLAHSLAEQTGIRLPGPENGIGGGMAKPEKVELVEDDDAIQVDGKILRKPFVEKPVSGEDHNIRIFYPKSVGGGGRRLFRKVNNKSSEWDANLTIPRAITEPSGSYIYEQFLQVENAEDVKAYTVGTDYVHAETRKSPVVDGVVKRNPNGKEVRYITTLTQEETDMAARIVQAFGQRVCGFDLLRADDKSFVIDVNGWSFVKDNNEYYDQCARILKELFLHERSRKDGNLPTQQLEQAQAAETGDLTQPRRATGHRNTLKSLLHSPSMTKLTGMHPHLHFRHGSPDTTPISSPPAIEKSALMQPPPPVSTTHAILPSAALSEEPGTLTAPVEEPASTVPAPASAAQWRLKGVVSVVRHADRTPKQKFKFTFHTKPFVDLLRGHQEEVLLIGEGALNSVLDAVEKAFEEGVEDTEKLKLLRTSLIKKGAWMGTKVQIKPMFRKRKSADQIPEHAVVTDSPGERKAGPNSPEPIEDGNERLEKRSDSSAGVTLSRISAVEQNLELDKLQLIIKWGGEPTHSARYQAQDFGENLRNDMMLMNRDILDDVVVFSSSERRVTTSAQIFSAALLNQKDLETDFVTVRKDLLDDSNAAKDEMDKVKKKLKVLLREGDAAPPQFAWPENTPEPYEVVKKVVSLMKFHRDVMRANFAKLRTQASNSLAAAVSGKSNGDLASSASTMANALTQAQTVAGIQSRWCCGEDAELFRERWEKLFKEYCDSDKVDPSKISELYDTMKFDALHNRQFLEWIFTPDSTMLGDLDTISEVTSPSLEVPPGSITPGSRRNSFSKSRENLAGSDRGDEDKSNSARPPLVQRLGLRRRSDAPSDRAATAKSSSKNIEPAPESYFKLYTGNVDSSKLKVDARLSKLRELNKLSKILFDYIGPQEYGISVEEKLEIGLLTSLPLLKEIVKDLEELQASYNSKGFFYFTKESHIYTLLNCILEGGVPTRILRKDIPELDYLAQINFELYESQNLTEAHEPESFNYSIKITISPGCHTFDPLDVQLDSKHCIGIAPRRSLTAHQEWKSMLETLKAKFNTVKLPKSFIAVNLSEKFAAQQAVKEDYETGNDEEGGDQGLNLEASKSLRIERVATAEMTEHEMQRQREEFVSQENAAIEKGILRRERRSRELEMEMAQRKNQS